MRKQVPYEKIRDIFLELDPIGVYFKEDQNYDEYDAEIDMILKKLPRCKSEKHVQNIVWDTFKRQFGDKIAGSPVQYRDITRQIWDLLQSC